MAVLNALKSEILDMDLWLNGPADGTTLRTVGVGVGDALVLELDAIMLLVGTKTALEIRELELERLDAIAELLVDTDGLPLDDDDDDDGEIALLETGLDVSTLLELDTLAEFLLDVEAELDRLEVNIIELEVGTSELEDPTLITADEEDEISIVKLELGALDEELSNSLLLDELDGFTEEDEDSEIVTLEVGFLDEELLALDEPEIAEEDDDNVALEVDAWEELGELLAVGDSAGLLNEDDKTLVLELVGDVAVDDELDVTGFNELDEEVVGNCTAELLETTEMLETTELAEVDNVLFESSYNIFNVIGYQNLLTVDEATTEETVDCEPM
ncbi:hypothetical protein HYALB_00008034 [Hymenoscyphus albidus]|uniref:Uncharacterized protein n=1 Tax=Hymenoscyphus albidus TaxID=595503 RepID=A0A9N9LJ77_9HELO|nr:hypothetical protein HYALB_00008034 [Hymenoscyphus albidus]